MNNSPRPHIQRLTALIASGREEKDRGWEDRLGSWWRIRYMNSLVVKLSADDVTIAAGKFGTIRVRGSLDGVHLFASGVPLKSTLDDGLLLPGTTNVWVNEV